MVRSAGGIDRPSARAPGASRGAPRARLWSLALCSLLQLLWLLPSDAAAAAGSDALSRRLDLALQARALDGASLAVLVVRERDGRVLYARSPDLALIPASNQKLLTAIAALDLLGPSHQFETVIRADRAFDADGRVGELAVQGGGDPVMNSEDWWRLAADLRRSGLERVSGDLIVDDSVFDAQYWHPDWGKVSARAYHAPVGGLSANYGAYFVEVRPGAQAGASVEVDIDPPLPYLQLRNAATTGSLRAKRTLSVGRGGRSKAAEVVQVSGVVRVGDEPDVFPRSVSDPALYAGAVLKMQLEAVGIRVDGSVRRGSASGHVAELLRFRGRPLAEIVRLFVKYSNNSIAESLVKSIGAKASGAPGSWPSGLAEIERRLAQLGLTSEGLVLADGSGLSTANRVSPRLLVDALRMAHRSFDFGPELMVALPIAARDGTLEKRARAAAGEVRAKTGLLSDGGVTSLSGYARLGNGELAVFSILVNQFRNGGQPAMNAVDDFVAELLRETKASSTPARAPRRATD